MEERNHLGQSWKTGNKPREEKQSKAHLLMAEVVPLTIPHKPPIDSNAISLPNPTIKPGFVGIQNQKQHYQTHCSE